MAESLHSPSWYRVAELRPQLREHARLHRHRYRGQVWHVIEDPAGGRTHRLTPSAWLLAGLMTGTRTTHEIWQAANERLGDEGPTQDETIRLLGMLHAADLLRCDVNPDLEELFRRCQRRARGEGWRRSANPLALRIPLLDPDPWLERWAPLVRPLFSRVAGAAWLAIVAAALLLAASHSREIGAGATRELLEPRNLLLLWLLYPLVKGLHELGHGFAARVWGGQVREMGILLLVLMPVPYVDASASAAFPDKWRRAAVAASGIGVELLLAAVALFVWVAAEPGWVRSIAYNVMWIGGVSTLLFNGNPLLRFDGYYVLADLLEIPNLAQRANQYVGYLVQRHAFGLDRVRTPASTPREGPWLALYAVAAFAYRLSVSFGIALFLASRFFVVGVVLALFAVTTQVVRPLVAGVAFLWNGHWMGEQRPRALAVSIGGALGLAVFALVIPLPSLTVAQGVVWPPERAQVRASADGFVAELLVEPGSAVEPGQPLVLTREPALEAELAAAEARLRELRAKLHAERTSDRVRAQGAREEVATAAAEVRRLRERVGDVVVRSPGRGSFVSPHAADLLGRFVHQGESIGYVIGPAIDTVRVVVPQEAAAAVRDRTLDVEVRLAARPREPLGARIQREVPGASSRLPHPALGAAGGGPFAIDPADEEGLETLDAIFQVDVSIPASAGVREIGARAHVRFWHGTEPLAVQASRALRRVFLRQLGV